MYIEIIRCIEIHSDTGPCVVESFKLNTFSIIFFIIFKDSYH